MRFELCLPKRPEAAAQARRVVDRFDDRLDADARATAYLLVTEVVANAVRHVEEDGDIALRVACDEARLRVEVEDPGPGFEVRPRHAGSPLDSGWGMHLLAKLSDDWGVERGRVWFDLTFAATA